VGGGPTRARKHVIYIYTHYAHDVIIAIQLIKLLSVKSEIFLNEIIQREEVESSSQQQQQARSDQNTCISGRVLMKWPNKRKRMKYVFTNAVN